LIGDRFLLLNGSSFHRSLAIRSDDELTNQLETEREKYTLKKNSMAELFNELKGIIRTCDQKSVKLEKELCHMVRHHYDQVFQDSHRTLELIKADHEAMGRLFNERVAYFSQLQVFSDHVVSPEKLEKEERMAYKNDIEKEVEQKQKILMDLTGRLNYLTNLLKSEQLSCKETKELKECRICLVSVDSGFLTRCGHVFHEHCLTAWLVKHRRCPVCNQNVTPESLNMISLSLDPTNQPEDPIDQMSLVGSFGTKIDRIIKHLKYLRQKDPKCKSIIFSQWEQVLDIVGHGLKVNGLKFVSLTAQKKKIEASSLFHNDPSVAVFLLNAKSQSAGLTLVAATHLFLLEPVLTIGIELQGNPPCLFIASYQSSPSHRSN
jgi:E3 ubiquitin-protein ligase SHPRH